MDTKSKNSKKFSLVIAGTLIILAAVIFMAFYPVFYERASRYEENILQSDGFLEQLYEANFVLYKEMAEISAGENLLYSDLFLSIEKEDYDSEEYAQISIENCEEQARRVLDDILGLWQQKLKESLFQNLDYCMVDSATDRQVKNTESELDRLGTEDADDVLNEKYPYYIKLTYDSAGFLKDVSVRGEGADSLLKRVQSTMKGYTLRNDFMDTIGIGSDASGNIVSAFYSDDTESYRVRYTISGPKNVTVCYALTTEQKEAMSQIREGDQYYHWYAYYQAGAPQAFRVILIALLLCALLLPLMKRYTLHQGRGAHLYLEFSLPAGLFWVAVASELTVYLMNSTKRGYFEDFYREYLTMLPIQLYPVLTFIVNLVSLSFLFGVWFYLSNSLGEVVSLGVKEFVLERSLIVKCWRGLCGLAKRNAEKLKEEILHVDLGEKANKTILKLVVLNFAILAIACTLWMFGWFALFVYSAVLYFGLKKYVQKIQEQYRKVLTATRSIAGGNLNTSLEEDFGVFESYKKELASIQAGFKKAVEEEVRSQRMKTELITNVSHDLKTPLTAITTYVELLEDNGLSQEKREEYLGVLKKKTARLRFLIEDLFEVSKASSGNVTLNPVDVDICNLIRQVYLEYEDKVEEADLIFRFSMPEEKVILKLDSQKTYRIFENLYTNAIKYAMPHTRVYVVGEKTEKGFHFEMKNMSACELNVNPDELTERFVRGDSARNTEGSGLGLAIARSFTELQGGKLKVEIDGDLYKVMIDFTSNFT
ncbi:MAG: HAMP domain-containing histidine kinase [Lachnospiraceae bacterium]|nr:HAMP domain-containing histidine kinase [Lachnospiraceae bacterium]